MESPIAYLIVKGCAGLGNRLVTIHAAIEFCKKNNRTLIVDWTDGQFDLVGSNAFDKCFEINGTIPANLKTIKEWDAISNSSILFKENKTKGVYDLYVEKHSRFIHQIPRQLLITPFIKKIFRRWQPIQNGNLFNSINFGSDLAVNSNYDVLYYVDFLPQIDYAELPNEISLKKNIMRKVDEFVSSNQLSNAVGVHIRSTDKRPTKELKRIIDLLKTKHKHDSVFLSTDSLAVESILMGEKLNLILFPKHKPELKGEGLHQWALYNNADELKYTFYEESVIEMFLLSKCKYLYYQGNSTFSNISRVYHTNKSNCYDWLKL